MGVYLSQPVTDKSVHQGGNDEFKFTACEMQGWRKSMEDAKITVVDIQNNGKKYAVFGVFDGHGGIIVVIKEPKYQHLLKLISLMNSRKMSNFKKEILKRHWRRALGEWTRCLKMILFWQTKMQDVQLMSL